MAWDVANQVSKAQRVYLEGIHDAYQKEADFYRFFTHEIEEVATSYTGRQVVLETKANPSLSFGSLDNGDLATPNNPTLDNFLVTYQWLNCGFRESYGSILNNDKETVGDPQRRALKSSAKQFVQWMNYYLSDGDGTTRLATASANYAGGTPTVMTCNGSTDSLGATRIVDGQRGYIYDSTGTTQRTGTVGSGVLTVSSHTKTAITFTSNAPSDFVSGDIFVPEGTNTTGIKGLPYLVKDTGNYFNKSRSSVTQLQSQIITVSGALTAALLLRLHALCAQASGDAIEDRPGTFCMAYAQWYNYMGLITPVSYNFNGVSGEGSRPPADVGFKSTAVTWFGAPMKCFLQINGNSIYRLQLDTFKMATLKKPGQLHPALPIGGGEWAQQLSTTAGNYAAGREKWMDFAGDAFTTMPFKQGALLSINMTVGKQKGD